MSGTSSHPSGSRSPNDPFREGERSLLEQTARGAPLTQVLEGVVRLVESQSTGMTCSILLLDRDGRTLRHGAAPSLPREYAEAIDGASIGPKAGSCGTAAFRGERVVVEDIETHPYWDDYKHLILPHGLRACWSSPVFGADRQVLGTFAMYYPVARGPSRAEQEWVQVATHVAAIVIARERLEEDRRWLLEGLRERVKELTLVHDVARLIEGDPPVDAALLQQIVALLPRAWLRPDLCEASVSIGPLSAETPGWGSVAVSTSAQFAGGDARGAIEVGYRVPSSGGAPPQFLREEHALLRSVADMLGTHASKRRAADELRQSEERLASVIAHTPNVGVQWYDAEGRVLFANDASFHLFGWEGVDPIGKTLEQLNFPEVEAKRFMSAIRDVERTGAPAGPLEFRYQRPDGTLGILLSTVFKIPYAAGSECFVCMDVDITAHRRAEERRQELEERLHEAQRLEALGTLTGGIAHDFNNILTAILAHVDLAVLDPSGADLQASLRAIRNAGRRGSELVRRLLRFSGSEEPSRERVSVEEVIDEVLDLLRVGTPTTIVLEKRVASSVPEIDADPTQLHQVLMNLCKNAVQAIPGNTGRVTITLEGNRPSSDLPDLPPGEYVRLVVSDTGAGMDAATAQRVFEPFFTTKAVGQGTGLGLSVVHGVIKAHGGGLRVDSSPDQGTKFHLYFPQPEEPVPSRPRVSLAPTPTGQHVFYIDDDEELLLLTSMVLRRIGYRVSTFTNPAAMLDQLKDPAVTVDAVISDVSMPGTDGPRLLEIVREIRPNVRAILVSGYVRPEDIERARHLGLPDVTLKPNTVAEFAELLRGLLPHSGAPSN